MARETKAERQAREAAEAALLDQRQSEQYLPLLMTALEQATRKFNYELEVRNGMFWLRDRDDRDDVAMQLSPTYNLMTWDALDSLEFELSIKAAERAEEERKYAVKKAALAKLTQEEKDLLNL